MDEQEKLEKRRAYDREWKKNYRLKNPEKAMAQRRARYNREKNNPEMVARRKVYMREYRKTWTKENPEKAEARRKYRREWMKVWNKKNSKKIYARRRQRPYEKLAATMRSRIYDYLKHGYKSDKTEKLLGITMKELMAYLEKQFLPGMSWDNYGFYGWHVDHCVPLASFDLTKAEEQKKAFHYTNLQPLWAKDNMRKGAKMV